MESSRKRGGTIEPGAVAEPRLVQPDGGKEAAPEANSQSTPRELPTTNTTEGENGVYRQKDELESIVKRPKENQASEDKIQAV